MRTGAALLLLALAGCQAEGHARWSFGARALDYAPAATSITPITSIAGGASGFSYSGAAYDVSCTVSGTVTLYPAVYDSTATPPGWEVFQGYPCALDSSVVAEGTCIFPARSGSGLTWNAYKTGGGTVSSCTATGRSGGVPASRAAPTSGPGSGTVTSVGLALPSQFTVAGSPVTGAGTLTGAWVTQVANLVLAGPASGGAAVPDFRALVAGDIPALDAGKVTSGTFNIARIPTGTTSTTVPTGGVVAGAACAFPASVTYNDAGQVTACTAGSAPASIAIIGGGATTAIAGGQTNYFTTAGVAGATIDAVMPGGNITRAATARNLYCNAETAPGGGQSETFTVRLYHSGSWADTLVTCPVSGGSSPATCADTTHTQAVVAGDKLGISAAQSGASTAAGVTCSLELAF